MKEYKLRYNGKGNIDYTERNCLKNNRYKTDIPSDEFGRNLEESIKELVKKFPNKSISIEIKSW